MNTFSERAKHFMERAAAAAETWYDGQGNWTAPTLPAETRERYWISAALYESGREKLADAVIRLGPITRGHMGGGNPSTFDIFHSNIAAVLLAKYKFKMAADIVARLEGLVRDAFGFLPGNRRPDFQFHGYNDNMPAKATMGLILGGELLDEPDAVEYGLWNLRQCRAMLWRRGIISEWNSPTYSAATTVPFAEIAEHARNPEAREIARQIEERIWLDIAARFHPETGVLAGPYARAYTVDLLAHTSCVSMLLWFVLGDIARPSAMELFNPRPGTVLHHMNDLPFNISQACWFSAGVYHLPPRALDLFTQKTYPFRAFATAETGDASADFPAREVSLETWLHRDFTLGTSNTPFLNGVQCASYFVTYKRAAKVSSFADVGTVYHKITVNGVVPGTVKSPQPIDGRVPANSGEEDNVESCANVLTLQSGPSALVLTHPHLALGGLDEDIAPRQLSRVDELVIFPTHFGGADEIRVGDRNLDSWSGEVPHGQWIGCRRGRLLIAIRPLAYTAAAGPLSVRLETANRYQLIRTPFYDGPARSFTRSELRKMYGGFLAEHASIDEYPSLAVFLDDLAHARFTDFVWTTRRVRYRRPAGGPRPALEFEISFSPGSTAPRYATVNGSPIAQDVRVSIDGLTDADFPFLNHPWNPVPPYFPWKRIEADWGAGLVTGPIGDREY